MSSSRNRDPKRGWSEVFDKHADPDDDSEDLGADFDEATEFSPLLDSSDNEHPRFGGDADATAIHETFERAVGDAVEGRDHTVIDDSHLKKEIEARLAQLDGFETEDTPLLQEDSLSRPPEARSGRYESAAQATLQGDGKPAGSDVGPTLPGDVDNSIDARIRAALNRTSAHHDADYNEALPPVEVSEDVAGKAGFEPTVASAKMPIFDDDDATLDGDGHGLGRDKTSAYIVESSFDEATMETRAASAASQDFEPVLRDDTLSSPPGDLDLGLDDDGDELPAYASVNPDEATRAAPIPHELLKELARPDSTARRAHKKRRSEVEVTPVPMAHRKTNEDTDLDLAAMIGVPARPVSVQEPQVVAPPQPARPSGLREEGALRVGMEDILDPAAKAKARKPKKPPKKGPREGVSASQFLRLSDTTSNIARIIPLGLGMFVIVATVIISLSFFETTSKQRHVELNFLAVGSQESPPMRRVEEGGTQLVIETTPPDVLVLYGGKILGKTPLTTSLHIEITGPVGVELSSPYFERWLTQTERTITNELRIEAELKKKR